VKRQSAIFHHYKLPTSISALFFSEFLEVKSWRGWTTLFINAGAILFFSLSFTLVCVSISETNGDRCGFEQKKNAPTIQLGILPLFAAKEGCVFFSLSEFREEVTYSGTF